MKTYSIKSQTVIVRAEAAQTGGICAVLEMHHPPNTGSPLHRHQNEDEGFFVLEGRYRFVVGEQAVEAEAGAFVMAPRNLAHAFYCMGPEAGKLLVYFTPAGVETYFETMSQIALDDPERSRKCSELNERFGMITLGKRKE